MKSRREAGLSISGNFWELAQHPGFLRQEDRRIDSSVFVAGLFVVEYLLSVDHETIKRSPKTGESFSFREVLIMVKEVTMQKWEYLRLDISYSSDGATIVPNYDPVRALAVNKPGVIHYLNRLGKENWELVNVFSDGRYEVYFFKHPIE